ncbi:hypothetical protein [Varibaculum vaginae]|uniref:hypothetical protein n=1 Tax=Varibaculum vaginae TaxID=2364797 RepID=UPI000F08C61C|nr:hypothetical protein [Varibaculum vaginae]
MSNPEPQGFTPSNPQSGANWPFPTPQGQIKSGQEPVPAFPAPAAPPAQNVPQYSQQSVPSAAYPLAGGRPLSAAVQPVSAPPASTQDNPQFPQPQPVVADNPLPSAQPIATPGEQYMAFPISDPLPEKRVAEQAASDISIVAVPQAVGSADENGAEPGQTETDSLSGLDEIQESLQQQALTPWWLDGLMALSLAGVMVFNGFGVSMGLRIGSLIAMVIALVLITWYQGDAQEKSNTFLTATLLGVICGFLAGLIVVAASLYMVAPIPAWYPWVLWLVSGALLFLTYRGFRDWVMQNLQKKSHRKSTK